MELGVFYRHACHTSQPDVGKICSRPMDPMGYTVSLENRT